MPDSINHQVPSSHSFWMTIRRNLNFFRVHLLFFTFTPLIFSGILYASNGRYPITYIDALFNSVSAVTVCGLATVNLSQLTPWQQVVLFLQMCVGSPVLVSWFMVYIRRYFFARTFEHIIQAEAARRAAPKVEAFPESATSTGRRGSGWRPPSLFRRRNGLIMSPVAEETASEGGGSTPKEKEASKKLRTDMIRRMDAPPKLVNPSGWISESITVPLKRLSAKVGTSGGHTEAQSSDQPPPPHQHTSASNLTSSPVRTAAELGSSQPPSDGESRSLDSWRASDPDNPRGTTSGPSDVPFHYSNTPHGGPHSSSQSVGMPRTATVEFAPILDRQHMVLSPAAGGGEDAGQESSDGERRRKPGPRDRSDSRKRPSMGRSHGSMMRNPSQHTYQSVQPAPPTDQMPQQQQRNNDFGGFPMPHEMLGMLFRRLFPRAANRLHRTMTIPTTTALTGGELGRTPSVPAYMAESVNVPESSKPVAYISFDAVVGRNSTFHMLTYEQLEELGGVEYRALNALLWLVALYHIGIQLVSFVVAAPYMSLPKWAADFIPPALIRPVPPPWFSLFQIVSSYTNTGMSLVDQSMVPFQTAYPLIFFMMFCILAGNTAFPIFLRFMIWTITKFVPAHSRLHETLHFLLDHPRRCFVYLFPSHQTWFLLTILLVLNLTDFICFLVLDIGNPIIDSIPFGTRFVAGLLQSIAVRAAGFGIVPVASVAPAVKVMYIIMMYISVYPIALSVRSTNVYEEQSLGIFNNDDGLSDVERAFQFTGSRMTVWGRYLAMHARHQLSFDMWWLALALFLVCIIEKDNLINAEIQGWFNIFTILFELVSAYGSVGLSLGIPTQNYSFSGALRPLSKLIVCLVMIRGRHRGLPVAIDRAIILPYEFKKAEDDLDLPPGADERRSSRYSAGNAPFAEDGLVDDDSHGRANAEKQDDVRDGSSESTEMQRRTDGRRRGSQDVLLGASGWEAPRDDQVKPQ